MKVLIGAAAAVLLMAAPAFAQTNISRNCGGGYEPAPTLPDGATANRAAVEAAQAEVVRWAAARHAKVQACQADIRAVNDANNAAAQEHQSVTAAWTAEVEEFNARGSASSNRRERGSTLTRPDRQ